MCLNSVIAYGRNYHSRPKKFLNARPPLAEILDTVCVVGCRYIDRHAHIYEGVFALWFMLLAYLRMLYVYTAYNVSTPFPAK